MGDYIRLSKGLRRHIRQEKAAIRRQLNDTPEAREKIKALVEKFFKQDIAPKVESGSKKIEARK